MIVYDKLWKTMKEKGISQYKLIKDYEVSAAQIHRMKKNMNISTYTANMFCEILDCRVEDIMEYVADPEKEKSKA